MTRRISYDEWVAEGKKLFGDDMTRWVFRCPSCEQPQSGLQFAKLRLPQSAIDAAIGRRCIGNFLKIRGSLDVVPVGHRSKGAGCTMTELHELLPVVVVHIEEVDDVVETMEWA